MALTGEGRMPRPMGRQWTAVRAGPRCWAWLVIVPVLMAGCDWHSSYGVTRAQEARIRFARTGELTVISGLRTTRRVFDMSPDGRFLAVCCSSGRIEGIGWGYLLVLDLDRGEVVARDNRGAEGVAFSADGSALLLAYPSAAWVYRRTGEGWRRDRLYSAVSRALGGRDVALSPGGREIAFWHVREAGIVDTQTGGARLPETATALPKGFADEIDRAAPGAAPMYPEVLYAPDGRRLATVAFGELRVVDTTTGRPRRCPLPRDITRPGPEPRGPGVWLLCFSPAGRLLALGTRKRILLVDVEHGRVRSGIPIGECRAACIRDGGGSLVAAAVRAGSVAWIEWDLRQGFVSSESTIVPRRKAATGIHSGYSKEYEATAPRAVISKDGRRVVVDTDEEHLILFQRRQRDGPPH